MMHITPIVFSPTGGTQRVADILAARLGEISHTVDLTDPALRDTQLTEDDVAVIAVPSFGGRVPALAAQRLSLVHGAGARCVLVCVYGNRAYEDTLTELEDLAVQSGFRVTAAVAAIAEHSIMHQYASGRPDAQDEAALKDFAEKIREKLEGGAGALTAAVPGNRPYKKAGGGGMVPKADGNCTACGLCATKCPAQAISRDNIRTADAKACISCMRCAAVCPQSARKLNGAMVVAASLAMKKVCSVRKENELYL